MKPYTTIIHVNKKLYTTPEVNIKLLVSQTPVCFKSVLVISLLITVFIRDICSTQTGNVVHACAHIKTSQHHQDFSLYI